eukprot:5251914-Pyramimonas_sp.AAC.1
MGARQRRCCRGPDGRRPFEAWRDGPCRGSRDGGQCKRGSAPAPDLAGSCRARAAPTRVWVQDPAGS